MSALELRPGLADVPVAESAISFIDGKRARLEYRGIAVETLARESSFEETTWLLLKGDLPTQRELADFDEELRHHRRSSTTHGPDQGLPTAAIRWTRCRRRRGDGHVLRGHGKRSPAANWESTLRLIAKLPTIVAAFHRLRSGEEPVPPRDDLDHAGNFYYMLFDREPSPAIRKVLDACLILHAEHTMNASTFAAASPARRWPIPTPSSARRSAP